MQTQQKRSHLTGRGHQEQASTRQPNMTISALWKCVHCERTMQQAQKNPHLIGLPHLRKVQLIEQSNVLESTTSGIPCETSQTYNRLTQLIDKHVRTLRSAGPSVAHATSVSPTFFATHMDESPLDQFFSSYPGFRYQPSIEPSTSFNQLQRYYNWTREDEEGKEAWREYQDALQKEFTRWYGDEDDLGAWHSLCRAIGIEKLPKTCKQCLVVSLALRCES